MPDLPAIIPATLRLHLLAALMFASLGGWLGGPKWTMAIALGAAIGAANLKVLGWVATRLMQGDASARNRAVLVLALKLAALCTVVGFTVYLVPMPLVGFLVGFSAAPLGLLLAATLQTHTPGASAPPQP
jgi:hypothetical protein